MRSTACGLESTVWRFKPIRQRAGRSPWSGRVMDKTLSYVVAVLLVAMSGTVFGNVAPRLVADIYDYGAFEITRRY